jgi:putative ABC transport system permease protein
VSVSSVRFAQIARALARSPAYSGLSVLCIALGISANTIMFSVISNILLHPLPLAALNELVVIQDDFPGLGLRNTDLSPSEAADVSTRSDLFVASGAFTVSSLNLTGRGDPQRIVVAYTLGDLFSVFRVTPYTGTFYGAGLTSYQPQVVVSYRFWQDKLGKAKTAVGQTIDLDGAPYQIVGVLPPGFSYPRGAAMYLPYRYDGARENLPGQRLTLKMVAVSRTRIGVSRARLAAALRAEAVRWRDRFGGASSEYALFRHSLRVTPFVDTIAGPVRSTLLLLMGAVGAVLLIACANVASLQLVRSENRAGQLAVRSALGAHSAQLIRLVMIETGLLALVGGAIGVGTAFVTVNDLTKLMPPDQQPLTTVRLDPLVLLVAIAATTASALLIGVIPAWRAGRTTPASAMRDGARGMATTQRRRRLLEGIIVAQVALTTMLLLTSGLLARSFSAAFHADPGFRPVGVVTSTVTLPHIPYETNTRVNGFWSVLLQHVTHLPGVEAAGLTSDLPLSGDNDSSPFAVVGHDIAGGGAIPHANLHIVSAGYFRALGIPVLHGRLFEGSDDDLAPLAVVIDQQLAAQFFPGEDPIGHQIDQGPRATIVGVVGSANQTAVGETPKATTYYAYQQRGGARRMTLVVRSSLPFGAVAGLLRRAIAEADPTVPIDDVRSMIDHISDALSGRRLASIVLSGFAFVSLVLAACGLFGVLSYSAAQRRHEFGIRLALGASQATLVRMILHHAATLTVAGISIGLVLFIACSRWLSSLLFGVGPRDPITTIVASVVVGVTALLASLVSGWQAGRVDPATTLRSD